MRFSSPSTNEFQINSLSIKAWNFFLYGKEERNQAGTCRQACRILDRLNDANHIPETQQIKIYQSEDGQTRIQVRLEKDTLWLSQAQMAELFGKDSDTIGLHLKNIYQSGELEKSSTTEESSVVRREGIRQVSRKLSSSMATDMGRWLVDILSRYTQTFLCLQQYDEVSVV